MASLQIESCMRKVGELKSRRSYIQTLIVQKKEEVKKKEEQILKHEKARWVFTEVARLTQEKFEGRVNSLATMAIKSVFDRPFSFKLLFERKRNALECTPVVMEGENTYIPKDDMGGGIIDIISFAFRVVLWGMEKPRSRALLVLDEPFRFMGSLSTRAGQMIRELSNKLNLQFLIVTHEPELAAIGDSTYWITHDGTQSVCKRALGTVAESVMGEKDKPVTGGMKRTKKAKSRSLELT